MDMPAGSFIIDTMYRDFMMVCMYCRRINFPSEYTASPPVVRVFLPGLSYSDFDMSGKKS